MIMILNYYIIVSKMSLCNYGDNIKIMIMS